MADSKRLIVINHSILVERLVSAALSSLLDIDLKSSKTLGNKSGGFSFYQKLMLLTDIRATEKNSVIKFIKFSEIRNQFAHNFEVNDFQSCFSFLNGTEEYLRRTYPSKIEEKLEPEEQLQSLYFRLYDDVLKSLNDILTNVTQKFIKEGRDEFLENFYKQFFVEMREYSKSDSYLNEKLMKVAGEILGNSKS
jgi:hypothetical protein